MTSAEQRFACQCCGWRVLDEPTPGSYTTCPICDWTDDALTTPAAREALYQARACYAATGASSRDSLDAVRAAAPGELRVSEGLVALSNSPRAEAAAAARGAIVHAFGDVPPGDRVTLTGAYRADGDGSTPRIDWDDWDSNWRDIPGEVLDFFGNATSVFVFGNLASFRYYLPAYMLRAIETGDAMRAVSALDRKTPGTTPEWPAEVEALNPAQRAAVVAFLRFVVDFLGPDDRAERALARIWLPATAAP